MQAGRQAYREWPGWAAGIQRASRLGGRDREIESDLAGRQEYRE